MLDFLDGEVARQCKKTSKTGAVIDSINDAIFLSIIALNILKLDVSFLNIFIATILRLIVSNYFTDLADHTSRNKSVTDPSQHWSLMILFLLVLMWARAK